MTRLSSLLAFIVAAPPALAEPVAFSGTIGPYSIEMELDRAADGSLNGRYRYAGQDQWLTLVGEAFGRDAIQLEESSDGVQTGTFFLNSVASGFGGFWAGETSDFAVALKPYAGQADTLMQEMPRIDVDAGITGRYDVGGYWVNDWFAPNYEIGFNGGDVNVVALSNDQIFVQFEFIVGPTYHFASFKGIATRVQDQIFVHDEVLSGGTDPCRLEFSFDEGFLYITDMGNGFACQFGARAHANFDLPKVSDIAEFRDPW